MVSQPGQAGRIASRAGPEFPRRGRSLGGRPSRPFGRARGIGSPKGSSRQGPSDGEKAAEQCIAGSERECKGSGRGIHRRTLGGPVRMSIHRWSVTDITTRQSYGYGSPRPPGEAPSRPPALSNLGSPEFLSPGGVPCHSPKPRPPSPPWTREPGLIVPVDRNHPGCPSGGAGAVSRSTTLTRSSITSCHRGSRTTDSHSSVRSARYFVPSRIEMAAHRSQTTTSPVPSRLASVGRSSRLSAPSDTRMARSDPPSGASHAQAFALPRAYPSLRRNRWSLTEASRGDALAIGRPTIVGPLRQQSRQPLIGRPGKTPQAVAGTSSTSMRATGLRTSAAHARGRTVGGRPRSAGPSRHGPAGPAGDPRPGRPGPGWRVGGIRRRGPACQ